MQLDYVSYTKQLKTKADNKPKGIKKSKTKKVKTKGKIQPKKIKLKKVLLENMRQEYQINLSVDGSTDYVAGGVIELDESFGKFAGKYIIEKVVHKVDGDYVCDIEAIRM